MKETFHFVRDQTFGHVIDKCEQIDLLDPRQLDNFANGFDTGDLVCRRFFQLLGKAHYHLEQLLHVHQIFSIQASAVFRFVLYQDANKTCLKKTFQNLVQLSVSRLQSV